ncbi:immunity 42 family protein [Ruminococcus sp.]|uniref:immunity 42 family protein n=1 Tax=Ruminococcus sp. TaxID=41978 RepID=UPI0025F04D56|nr:immunity 42 family protein [Ruminococcus sp.]MBQ8965365.1 immunity 42 family protein [Ruminococcus sp.]
MFIGDTSYPNNFGFIIERMGWEDKSFLNGLMFLMINDELYPKYVRTTTFNCEPDELLDDDSPLIRPVVDKKMYQLDDAELFDILAKATYPEDDDKDNDYSYLIPFHEINDEGWSIFIISDGENIKLFVYDRRDRYPDVKLHDRLELPAEKYFKTISALKDFYTKLLDEWR